MKRRKKYFLLSAKFFMIDRRVINIKQVKMLYKRYVYFRLTMIYIFEKTFRIRIRTYIFNDLDPQPSFLFLFFIHSL